MSDSAAPDAGRVELPDLPRPTVCYADHSYPAFSAKQMRDYARAAIALADAEAAERVASANAERLLDDFESAVQARLKGAGDQGRDAARTALLSYIARLEAAAGTAGRDGDGGDHG